MTSFPLYGDRIALRPMHKRERYLFYRWATRSDATPWWYGSVYHDEVPSYEAFKMDWADYYFDERYPLKGQCFVIMLGSEKIGQINYNAIHPEDLSAELDIIIAWNTHQNKGYGTDAIRTLTRYLFEHLHLRRCRIEVINLNIRAIRAYEKSGYRHTYTYERQGLIWHVMEVLAGYPAGAHETEHTTPHLSHP
ncbi:MAG: GNAT family N-acetyltransferase [Bacteroidia bacterium]|nr:GNAT family N-acetyltransferase [Bacteroidia bacterium]